MNKNKFRVIYNRTLSQFVVVSELAKSSDKSSRIKKVSVESAVDFARVLPLTVNSSIFIKRDSTLFYSDYMYNALRHDHENVHKRLGDGYYEQRLVREQINQLTGRPFLGNYSDFESQYQALMNAGVTFAKAFNLTLGTKLSKEQVASLSAKRFILPMRRNHSIA